MNDAHGSFDDLLNATEPAIRPIVVALRDRIVALHPEAVEIVWPRQKIASYGVGPRKMSQHYAYIAPFTSYVNLGFYHGVALDDPARLLVGTGTRLRHMKLASFAEVGAQPMVSLLRAALTERRAASSSSSAIRR